MENRKNRSEIVSPISNVSILKPNLHLYFVTEK